MNNTAVQIDRNMLKKLIPLNQLSLPALEEIASKSTIETVASGRIICRNGDKDSRIIYLLSGQVEQSVPGQPESKTIKAKTPLETAIADTVPKQATLKAKTEVTLLYVDSDLLELLMSDTTSSHYEVTEISSDDSDDWMLTFLQSPAFLQLPTENIQQLLVRMEEISVKKGQVVIEQGGSDEYYYIIKSGSCSVNRKPYSDAADVLLAVLPTGSGFGEESLIINGKRNATIVMRENGTLMRLKKKDFLELLALPLINYLTGNQAKEHVNKGSIIIDVRSQEQIKAQPIGGTVNIPLSMLRLKFDSLNTDREYLLICNDGTKSSAAAFLMIQNGFKCAVLEGGIAKTSFSNKNLQESSRQEIDDSHKKQEQEIQKQSAALAQQSQQAALARKQAEQEILKSKQELMESRKRIASESEQAKAEAERIKKEAEQELERAKQAAQAAQQRQDEINAAIEEAETIRQASELARRQAEEEAAAIRQRAIEEAEYLKAEVAAAKKKMEEEAAKRKKQEQEMLQNTTILAKKEADKIRQDAISDVQQVKQEIEATRALLNEKLKQAEQAEAQKRQKILDAAKERAQELSLNKTAAAEKEANAIRARAKAEAERLNQELEQTRQQIKAEAEKAIQLLKQQKAESIPTELNNASLGSNNENVNLSSVKIPGTVDTVKMNNENAKHKAESIKAKLEQSQSINIKNVNPEDEPGIAITETKVHTVNNKTILESNSDIFIFKEPSENDMQYIDISSDEEDETEAVTKEVEKAPNPFMVENENFAVSQTTDKAAVNNNVISEDLRKSLNAQSKQRNAGHTNYYAIAASMLLIIAGAVFTLHATDTLKMESIAALFNSGNETTAIAKKVDTKKKSVAQAKHNAGVSKVENKFNNIVDGWNNFLSETKKPVKKK